MGNDYATGKPWGPNKYRLQRHDLPSANDVTVLSVGGMTLDQGAFLALRAENKKIKLDLHQFKQQVMNDQSRSSYQMRPQSRKEEGVRLGAERQDIRSP